MLRKWFERLNPLKIGVVGSIVAALCCFTPVLVVLLGIVGLSWLVGYLDYVLFPALFIFLGLTAYGLWRNRRAKKCVQCSAR